MSNLNDAERDLLYTLIESQIKECEYYIKMYENDEYSQYTYKVDLENLKNLKKKLELV